MDKNNIKKEYTNGEITIVWQSGRIIRFTNIEDIQNTVGKRMRGIRKHIKRCIKDTP